MPRPIALLALALACLSPLAAAAQEGRGFSSAGVVLEGGGYPSGDGYTSLGATARATSPLSWGGLTADLSLTSTDADGGTLTSGEALLHATARPAGWLALGPYALAGSQSGGGAFWALGVEALAELPSGWSAEIFFGETRGGALGGGETYATNKGLGVAYRGNGRLGGHMTFLKDTFNDPAGDEDFYRLGLGVDTRISLGAGREGVLSVDLGQHHFDTLDKRENWLSLGLTLPLGEGGGSAPGFSSRRGVLHRMPAP